jgi:cytidylate kinase
MLKIAIDGTAGSGKGTISSGVAKALGIYHLDSGAIYRVVTYKCLQEKIDIANEKRICEIIKKISFKIVFEKDKSGNCIQKNILDGIELGREIRTEEISSNVSIISQYDCVREFAKKIQLDLADKYNIIIEGRDIGTIVLPNADFKFFITATAEERAKRRVNQLSLPEAEFKNVLKEIKERDKRDMNRKISPLKPAKDSYLIDNTNEKSVDTIKKILEIIKSKE